MTVDPAIPGQQKPTPLPWNQLIIVLLIQFAEPVTGCVIYPFVNQFVRELDVTQGDEKAVGYYAGLIESMFFFSEFLTVLAWGRASDKCGRRVILLFGPLGLAIATLGFGLANKFWLLIVFRFAQGVFNGNIGVSKTVMAEITDTTNRGQVFSLMPAMWGLAVAIAPTMGGLLSHPAEQYPGIFGSIKLFQMRPYFLPCAAAAMVAFSCYIYAFIGLKETSLLINNRAPQDYGAAHTLATAADVEEQAFAEAAEANSLTPPPFLSFFNPMLRLVLVNYGLLVFADMACFALLPLMYSTPIRYGGLGLSPHNIGMIMGLEGLYNIFIQVFVAGRLIRRFGPRTMQIVGSLTLVYIMAFYPVLSYVAHQKGGVDAIVYALSEWLLFCGYSTCISIATCHMYVVDSASGPAALGTTNGIAQMLATGVRTFAPWIASSLFSISLEHRLAGGYLVYLVLLVPCLVQVKYNLLLPARLQNHH
ncbi:MFS general substrate transporter [Fistulina hepatica ATCC 64428]|uniref:MFS general substrate transporter n=1 Tax=Fistulina hepatica ATCC 64428 TaxID=1128425 RepID=A0A0D7AFY7_9AGAR|nr:MFS general substrate transporter [Fistulina hepatica ATCC 64428]